MTAPASSTASILISSLRRTLRPRDLLDDLVAEPALEPVGREAVAPDAEMHGTVDGPDVGNWDERRWPVGRIHPSMQLGPPVADSTAESFGQDAGAAQQPGHGRSFAGRLGPALGQLDLDVVDVAGEPAVGVHQLVIEQLEREVIRPGIHHAPAFVTSINGIAATATTTTMTR